MDSGDAYTMFQDLTTPHVADACLRQRGRSPLCAVESSAPEPIELLARGQGSTGPALWQCRYFPRSLGTRGSGRCADRRQ
jgi:hypothetical protein